MRSEKYPGWSDCLNDSTFAMSEKHGHGYNGFTSQHKQNIIITKKKGGYYLQSFERKKDPGFEMTFSSLPPALKAIAAWTLHYSHFRRPFRFDQV